MVTEEAKIVATEIDVEEIGVGATLGEEAEAAGIPTVMAIEGPGGDKLESKNNRA
jgi:hypothetical protein